MTVAAQAALRVLCEAGLQAPRKLTMAITGACNLKCGHCLVGAGEGGSAGHVPERTLRRLLTEFVELEGAEVCLTGGEPLCHPGWLRLLQFARSLGLEAVSVQTNGLLWTADGVAALRDLEFPCLTLQISLDGATAATHDSVRGAGAFAGLLTGLKLMVDGGLGQQIRLCFTEMRHNLADFPALLRLANSIGIQSVVAGSLVQSGRAGDSSLLAPPELEQYLKLRQRLETDQQFSELYGRIGTMAALEWGREREVRSDVCTFVENPYLTADGRLYPCVLMHADPHSVTGVAGKNLAAAFSEGVPIWAGLLRESSRRADELAACAGCPGQQFCGGGCMGRAWAATGCLCSVDDRCAVRRAIYSAASGQKNIP